MTTSKSITFHSNKSTTDGLPCGSSEELANKIESPSTPPITIASKRTEVGAVWSKDKLSPNRTRKTKDNKHCNKYQGKGRRGDPRMHAAVNARLEKPQLSLLQALIAGGFRFPDMKQIKEKRPSDDIYDEDNILLSQRKNQLSRRLRHLARKRDKILKRFPTHYPYPGMMNDAGDGDGLLCAPSNSSVNMTPPPSMAVSSRGSHLHNHTLSILLEQASRVEQELRRKHFSRQQQQQQQHHMQPPAPFSLAHHPDVKGTSASPLRSSPSSSLVDMFPQSNVLRGADNSGLNMSQPPSMALALLAHANESQRSNDNVQKQLQTLLQQTTSAQQELEKRFQLERQLCMQTHPLSLVHPTLTQSLVSSSLLPSSLGVDELFPQSNAGQVMPNSLNLGTSPLYPQY
jgi:hypothetical protein